MKIKIKILIVILCIWSAIGLFSASRYNAEYDCRNYSKDFESVVEKYLPINVKIMRGEKTLGGKSAHMWVKVWVIEIDPIILSPFPNSLLYSTDIKCFDSYSDYAQWV